MEELKVVMYNKDSEFYLGRVPLYFKIVYGLIKLQYIENM